MYHSPCFVVFDFDFGVAPVEYSLRPAFIIDRQVNLSRLISSLTVDGSSLWSESSSWKMISKGLAGDESTLVMQGRLRNHLLSSLATSSLIVDMSLSKSENRARSIHPFRNSEGNTPSFTGSHLSMTETNPLTVVSSSVGSDFVADSAFGVGGEDPSSRTRRVLLVARGSMS